MPRCPICAYRLSEDRDRVGSRCPRCRRSLYEPPGRIPRAVQAGEAACTVHPENASIGSCSRCGNFLCETCRTRWGDQVLCAACIDRALRTGDGVPGQKREHSRQAAFGLMGGVAAWLLTAGIGGIVFLLRNSEPSVLDPATIIAIVFAMFALLGTAIAIALVGLGFSAAALRTRGDSMIVATLGLLLSGLHVGALVGLFLFAVWLH